MSNEWVATVDSTSGKTYYYNRQTRETTWEMPVGAKIVQAPATKPAAAAALPAAQPQPEWKEVIDKSTGKSYYYNRTTKQTRWDPPESYIPAKEKASSALTSAASQPASSTPSPASTSPAVAPAATASGGSSSASPAPAPASVDDNDDANWRETFDPKSGKPYYYNRKTKQTTWEDPRRVKTQWGMVNPISAVATPAAQAAAAPVKANSPVVTAAAPTAASSAVPSSSSPAASTGMRRLLEDSSSTPHDEYKDIPSAQILHRPSKIIIPPPQSAPPPSTTIATPASPRTIQPPSLSVPKKPIMDNSDDDDDVKDDSEDDDDDDDKAKGANAPSGAGRQKTDDENVARLKLKEATDANEKKDARKLIEDEEKEANEEDFAFLFAKHRHGWLARTFRTGKVLDNQKIMKFKKSLIKKALLKQNRHLDDAAVQAFKNVMSYMGDRKSSKAPMEHAIKLLRNVMASPAGLRDEVFLQLCKQTTDNPRDSSTLLGWELITFCLACFPPSKPLKKFLTAYFTENKESTEKTGPAADQIKKFATEALSSLDRIMALGQRKEVPCTAELDSLKKLKGVSIRVYFLDNTFKTLVVDSFNLASDVTDMMIKKVGLTCTLPFALYEQAETERVINPKERVLDLMARWEHLGAESPEKKEQASKYRFLFKAKLVLKADNQLVKSDNEAINLLYMQSVHDVISAKYPVKENHLTILAALQLQATFGDYHPDMHGHGWLLDKLEQFIPSTILDHKNPKKLQVQRNEWEQKIISKYEKITGFTSLEAKLNYLDYVQEWPVYGVTLFLVEQRQFKDYPSPLLLGLTCEGALLMHPDNRSILDNYAYTDIVTWGHSDEKFILVVGNVVQQRKLVFKTTQGNIMNGLVHDYVQFKVNQKS